MALKQVGHQERAEQRQREVYVCVTFLSGTYHDRVCDQEGGEKPLRITEAFGRHILVSTVTSRVSLYRQKRRATAPSTKSHTEFERESERERERGRERERTETETDAE
jgi:23S rRNA G2069 N7-methylase RlmK/C1962 C5-methylase RlmI